jgi:hypothetical protein
VDPTCVSRSVVALRMDAFAEFVEQGFRLFQVGRVQAFGELAINSIEQLMRFSALAGALPQARQGCCHS